MRLLGKVIIVAGGTRGMGEAQVRGIVAEGGRVVFGGRDEAAGQAIASDLGEHALFVRQDVALEDDWKRIVATTIEHFGGLDGLVNNAGLALTASLAKLDIDDVQRMIGVNQISVMLGLKHIMKPMRDRGGGSVINVGSATALRAHAGTIAYAGTKAAVVGMSLSAAAELAPMRIRVNVLHPGFFDTRLLEESSRGHGKRLGVERTPLGRVAQPQEIVGAAVFLLSDESAFVTGAQLTVDGGLTL